MPRDPVQQSGFLTRISTFVGARYETEGSVCFDAPPEDNSRYVCELLIVGVRRTEEFLCFNF